MKKRFIFFTLLLLTWGVKFNVLNAQETVTIGTGTDYSEYRVPICDYSYYSISQQIYTESEINKTGTIEKIAFHLKEAAGKSTDVVIYMTSTTKESYADGYGWVPVNNADIVYQGSINTSGLNAGDWLNIELQKEFDYYGGSIAITFNCYTSNAYGVLSYFYIHQTDGMKCLYKNGSNPYDCSSFGNSNFYGNNLLAGGVTAVPNVAFTFAVEDDLEPAVPANLTATAINHTSIELTWDAAENAKKYNIYQGGEKIGSTSETSFTVEGLDAETPYSFTVTAVRGSKESEHSNEASATTAKAPVMRTIELVLTDSYGDGWNGNKMNVSYTGFNNDYENENLDGKYQVEETQTITIDVPVDAEVILTYKKGNGNTYPDENSFVIRYKDGDIIWQKNKGELVETISHTFTVEGIEPKLEVSAENIALGDVRMGNYWTEKPVSETFNVVAKNTTVTDVTCDNTFFEVVYESGVVTVSYDNTVDVSGEQTGTITIAAEGASATVAVSATPYTPATGDVWELAPVVNLSTGTFNSGEVTGMYDDYILPVETVDGNLNDAVYKFELENDALITATVEGTNPIVAIYDEDFNGEGGPSLDNNNTGGQSGPTAPTTFFYDFNDGDLSDFTLIDADGDGNNWNLSGSELVSNSYISGTGALTPNNYIVTNTAYSITQNSKLSFDVLTYGSSPEHCAVVVTSDINDFTKYTIVYEDTFDTGNNYSTKEIDLSLFKDQTLYIGLRHYNSTDKFKILVDNLTLTDGSAKSRAVEPQIDGVLYTAGTYYLVAAAEGNFTLNLKKVDYIAIDAPQVVDGGSTLNKYVGETVTLEWSTVDEVEGYRVYNGEDVLAELEGGEIDNYTTLLEDYNVTPGYTFYVTAYIGENESPKSEPIYVKVSGDVNINGTLTNGAGATLTFTGTDEFGQAQTYTTIVGNDGSYTIDGIKVGHYTITASKFDYQDFSAEIDVVYSVESVTLEHAMVEKPAAGNAIYSVSMSETQSGATVRWSANTAQNANQAYNIYRKDVESGVVTPIAQGKNLTQSFNGQYWDGSYEDDTYSSLPDGKSYQYGVTAMVAGEPVEVMREGFASGVPNTWSSTGFWYTTDGSIAIYPFNTGTVYTLTTPTIDLSGYDLSSLRFDYSTKNNIIVKVQKDGEQSWNTIKTISAQATQQMVTSENLDLNDYVSEKIKVCFEITAKVTYGYTTTIDNVIVSASAYSESQAVWSKPLKKGLNTYTSTGNWDDATKWSKGLPTAESEVLINGSVTIPNGSNVKVASMKINSGYDKLLTISNGASLTVTGSLECTAQNLLISDGGQLFQTNSDVQASFNMGIVNPSDEDMLNWANPEAMAHTGWQFIASPFIETNENNNITSFANNNYDYDLYKYDGSQEKEWLNHKAQAFTSFESGVGYLASQKDRESVNFIGTLNGETSHTYNVTYTEGGKFANFHLLGNPFSFNMDLNNVSFDNVYEAFATVDPKTGGYINHTKEKNPIIPVGDGFFVEAIGETPSISYPAQSKSRGEEKADYINVVASGKQGSNNVIIKLSGKEEKGFSKLENLNQSIADLYVKNNGRQYSVLGYDNDVKEVELFFDAKEMGNYTIGIEPNGKFQSVTLVDRMTGIETNMLLDSYTFTATANDNPNRFVIRLANSQEPTANSNFVYQSGEELIVNAEGTIQIIDVMGRMVYSNDVESSNNRINVSNLKGATYIVRNISNNTVRTQKIVIL